MRHTPSLRSCKEGCSVSVLTFDGPDFSCFSVMLGIDVRIFADEGFPYPVWYIYPEVTQDRILF